MTTKQSIEEQIDDEWVVFLTDTVILPATQVCMSLLRDDRNPPSKVYAHVAENIAPKLKQALQKLIQDLLADEMIAYQKELEADYKADIDEAVVAELEKTIKGTAVETNQAVLERIRELKQLEG